MVSCLHCWNNSIRTALGTVEPPSSATREAGAPGPPPASLRCVGLWLPPAPTWLGTWESICPCRQVGWLPGTPAGHVSPSFCFWAFWKASKSWYLSQLSSKDPFQRFLFPFPPPPRGSFGWIFSLLYFFNPTSSHHSLTFLWLVLT